ncbi:hemerythrin domain-containing protein [Nocardioides sp. cx-169]|uniref:hemerythrin domain-containing protein n=1 Tax=Nocardioides sp. cx-169 TaxID=2899080 RepID=UPI001E54AA06|nr:hemerythrin domain-containing protein [Nocardioides sp. cx-169]MCD4536024.1 hemerythrin domain-containing protein [Nocardioides sp. cx-169]
MGTTLNMNRVIHAAVRRDLDRLEAALADFAGGDAERAAGLHRAYEHLRAELHHHHVGEDTHIWPMLAGFGVDAGLLSTMESEHHAMAESLTSVAHAMDALAADPSVAAAAAARVRVADAREVVEQHLTHEENELEPVLLPYLGTPEWRATEKRLRSAPPRVTGEFFAWLQDGMDPEHRAFLRRSVPRPVTFVLGRVLGRRYHRDVATVWRA